MCGTYVTVRGSRCGCGSSQCQLDLEYGSSGVRLLVLSRPRASQQASHRRHAPHSLFRPGAGQRHSAARWPHVAAIHHGCPAVPTRAMLDAVVADLVEGRAHVHAMESGSVPSGRSSDCCRVLVWHGGHPGAPIERNPGSSIEAWFEWRRHDSLTQLVCVPPIWFVARGVHLQRPRGRS
jgi:hypothetical protein